MNRTITVSLTIIGLCTAMLVGALQWRKPSTQDYAAIDPTLLPGLSQLPNATVAELVILYLLPLARKHKGPEALPPPLPQPRNIYIEGPSGVPLRLVLIEPVSSEHKYPALLQIHGGGFIMGRPENNIPRLQRISQRLGVTIVVPDYRLAPEEPFPAALEDNYAALKWLASYSHTLGVDPKRIAVIGESGGGGLAALVALASRDRSGPRLCAQILIYPMLDDHTGSTKEHVQAGYGKFVWTPALNRKGWSAFLGVPAGSKETPLGAVPSRVISLSGLPPAFVGVGELDLFAPENATYAKRLQRAGVDVTFVSVPGAYHGFDQLNPDSIATKNFETAWMSAWQRTCAPDS